MPQKHCVLCRKVKSTYQFSASQLRKTVSKCSDCVLLENPNATPKGGNEPKTFAPLAKKEPVPKQPFGEESPFNRHTSDVLSSLRDEGKMRSYVPMEGQEERMALICSGCGRFTKGKRFGERFLCLYCQTICKELGIPLDMTSEEHQSLYEKSAEKNIALQLERCESIGEMAFTVAHSQKLLGDIYEENKKIVQDMWNDRD